MQDNLIVIKERRLVYVYKSGRILAKEGNLRKVRFVQDKHLLGNRLPLVNKSCYPRFFYA